MLAESGGADQTAGREQEPAPGRPCFVAHLEADPGRRHFDQERQLGTPERSAVTYLESRQEDCASRINLLLDTVAETAKPRIGVDIEYGRRPIVAAAKAARQHRSRTAPCSMLQTGLSNDSARTASGIGGDLDGRCSLRASSFQSTRPPCGLGAGTEVTEPMAKGVGADSEASAPPSATTTRLAEMRAAPGDPTARQMRASKCSFALQQGDQRCLSTRLNAHLTLRGVSPGDTAG